MLRGSDLHSTICGACAFVLRKRCASASEVRCAADCEKMGDDAQMKACAHMCLCCAQSCRQMSMLIA